MSYLTNYAARMRQLASDRADTAEAAADRAAMRIAAEKTRAEVSKRFPEITAESFAAALEYQSKQFEYNLAAERAKQRRER